MAVWLPVESRCSGEAVRLPMAIQLPAKMSLLNEEIKGQVPLWAVMSNSTVTILHVGAIGKTHAWGATTRESKKSSSRLSSGR